MDQSLLDSLLRAEAFPHPVTTLEVRETHISWVILTGDFAYKIKKPVNFGFLDFSTLQRRQHFCHEEIRLNQRLCPRIYLDVVAVVSRSGALFMEGEGDVIDYAVKMRQFDADATLADHLARAPVSAQSLQPLGYRIAEFQQQAERATVESGWGSADAVMAPVLENFRQIEPLLQDDILRALLSSIRDWSLHTGKQLRVPFTQRQQQGFVRELHGDLHSGNIALIDQQWTPFDCIEFNPDLRWIDTASDLAFLLMDLELRGFPAHANQILNACLEYSGDYALLQLLDFYRTYRAMVRAKVCILRMQQSGLSTLALDTLQQEFARYLDYALQLQKPRPRFLAVMMGVSGSGKSTVARQIAAQTGAIQLRSDATRKRLCGLTPLQDSASSLPGGIYTDVISRQTFAQLLDDAAAILEWGYPVIVDATFLQQAHRAPFLELAERNHVHFVIVHCQASVDELKRRILQRQQQATDVSEAGIEVMERQLQYQEPLSAVESSYYLPAETVERSGNFMALLQRQPHEES